MMMAKPTASEEDTAPAASTTAEPPAVAPSRKLPASTEDALKELEQRLLRLDGSDENGATATTAAPAPLPPKQTAPAPAPPAAAAGGGKSALLARIMAAQERAKQAQQKKPTVASPEAMTETEKMMRALNGESTVETAAPPSIESTPPPPPPPIEAALPPPPPPPPQVEFKAPAGPPPPSFASVEKTVMQQVSAPEIPPPSAPSAPPMDLLQPTPAPTTTSHLAGIQPVAPPTQTPPPPSFEQFEAQADEELFQFDLEGNALTPEQRREMMEEQRKILAQIKKDASRSASSAASAAADAFDSRSATAAAAAASAADRVATSSGNAPVGEDVIDVGVKHGQTAGAIEMEGQEKVHAAIREGTAKLTQCTSCESWLQVTQAATLLFCPICNTVCPVITADGQVRAPSGPKSADEELAEQLQKQEYEEAERARRSQQQRRAESSATQQPKTSSWWDTIFGSSTATSNNTAQTNAAPPPTSSRSPGLVSANTGAETDSQRYYSPTVPAADPSMLASAQTGEEERFRGPTTYERDSLLDGGATRGGARIAERKPLFACMVDGVTEAATSFSTALTARTLEEDGEGNVHGVDGSSLLVTRAGREPSGRYTHIQDSE